MAAVFICPGCGQLTGISGDVAARVPRGQVALVDLLDRVLAGGVVIVGDVTVSIADVDLIRISLRALVVALRAAIPGTDVSGHRPDHDR